METVTLVLALVILAIAPMVAAFRTRLPSVAAPPEQARVVPPPEGEER